MLHPRGILNSKHIRMPHLLTGNQDCEFQSRSSVSLVVKYVCVCVCGIIIILTKILVENHNTCNFSSKWPVDAPQYELLRYGSLDLNLMFCMMERVPGPLVYEPRKDSYAEND